MVLSDQVFPRPVATAAAAAPMISLDVDLPEWDIACWAWCPGGRQT